MSVVSKSHSSYTKSELNGIANYISLHLVTSDNFDNMVQKLYVKVLRYTNKSKKIFQKNGNEMFFNIRMLNNTHNLEYIIKDRFDINLLYIFSGIYFKAYKKEMEDIKEIVEKIKKESKYNSKYVLYFALYSFKKALPKYFDDFTTNNKLRNHLFYVLDRHIKNISEYLNKACVVKLLSYGI